MSKTITTKRVGMDMDYFFSCKRIRVMYEAVSNILANIGPPSLSAESSKLICMKIAETRTIPKQTYAFSLIRDLSSAINRKC